SYPSARETLPMLNPGKDGLQEIVWADALFGERGEEDKKDNEQEAPQTIAPENTVPAQPLHADLIAPETEAMIRADAAMAAVTDGSATIDGAILEAAAAAQGMIALVAEKTGEIDLKSREIAAEREIAALQQKAEEDERIEREARREQAARETAALINA